MYDSGDLWSEYSYTEEDYEDFHGWTQRAVPVVESSQESSQASSQASSLGFEVAPSVPTSPERPSSPIPITIEDSPVISYIQVDSDSADEFVAETVRMEHLYSKGNA